MVQNSIITKGYDEIQPVLDNTQIYTLIEIDGKTYAINTEHVMEILKIIELDYPDGMLSCVLGIIRFKDEPISVLDIREVFKKKRIVYDLTTKIVIVKSENTTLALACDKVLDIKRFEKDKITPFSYQQEGTFFSGVYACEDKNYYILDIEGIMDYIASNPYKFREKDANQYIVSDEASKKILKERKDSLNRLSSAIPTNISLYDSGVSFIIDNIKYYINMASVREFYKVKKSKFVKVPCTKDFIFGLINIKGEYITVLDIRKFYNNKETTVKEKSTIIILNSDEFKIGILADEICESIDINFDEIIQNKILRQDENKMYEFVKNDEIYQILDIEQLLKDDRLKIS